MLIRDLGLRDYVETWDLQRRLVEERVRGSIPDTVLLCQHPPVYTIGRSSRQPAPEGLDHPLHRVERGGDLTYHGPGQLVGYPIVDLAERGLGPRSLLRALEAILAEAIRPFGVEPQTVRGFTGLWTGRRKLASIGVAVRRGVAYHGFALNVNVDLAPFRRIHPCRLEPDAITSLRELLGRPLDERAVAGAVGRALLASFGEPAATWSSGALSARRRSRCATRKALSGSSSRA